MNLQSDDFTLFGLEQQFAQSREVLDAKWKELQREVHPDRFAAQGEAAQRIAMQWSVRINEAYQRLKDPVKRASYICELRGVPTNAHSNTAMPQTFLMQQMQWREALDEASGVADIESLQSEVDSQNKLLLEQIAQDLDEQKDAKAAADKVRAIMFLAKFSRDIGLALEKFE